MKFVEFLSSCIYHGQDHAAGSMVKYVPDSELQYLFSCGFARTVDRFPAREHPYWKDFGKKEPAK